jgi:hypothetical protein
MFSMSLLGTFDTRTSRVYQGYDTSLIVTDFQTGQVLYTLNESLDAFAPDTAATAFIVIIVFAILFVVGIITLAAAGGYILWKRSKNESNVSPEYEAIQ